MARQFVIRFNPNDPQHCSWCSVDGSSYGPLQQGSLDDAALQARGQSVVVLLPGSELLLTHANVPSKNRSRVLSAIPYALEESLIDEVDELHFAVGERFGEQSYPVAVISHTRMAELLSILGEAGIYPHLLLPEPLLLAAPEADSWRILLEAHQALIRQADGVAYSIELEALPMLLQSGLEQESRPQKLNIQVCAEINNPLADLPIEQQIERCPEALYQLLPGIDAEPINLLQGEYRRQDPLQKLWLPWRQPLIIAALLAILAGVGLLLEYQKLGEQEQQLRSEVVQLFRATFPDVKRVVNPSAQMKARLRKLRDGESMQQDFLKLLASGSQPLGGSDTTLVNLNFRKGYLEVELDAKQLQALDQLKQKLEANKLKVQLLSANTEKGQVRGRLRLESGS